MTWEPGKDPNIGKPVIDFWNPFFGYPKKPEIGDRYIARWGEYDQYYGKWDTDKIYEWTGKSWARQNPRHEEFVLIRNKQALYCFTSKYSCNNSWYFFLSFKNPEVLSYAFKIGILENKEFLRNISDEIEKGFTG